MATGIERVGWIGLGNMGNPMAKNLEKAGFTISVYNRSASKAADFKQTNATICGSIEELVTDCDVVFSIVSNDDALQAIYKTILSMDNIEGKLFVDMSTVSQQLTIQTAQAIKTKKAQFLDAPVAGSTKPAADGMLIIMVGGDPDAVERAQPYFQKMGKLVKHLGPNGKGIAAKLAFNYYVSMIYLGLAETVAFAEKSGVGRNDFLEIINESAVGSGATKAKSQMLTTDNYTAAFALELMLKDIRLAIANGADFPLTASLLHAYEQADKAGFGKGDVVGIINYLRSDK